ncbi:MAG TPA: histidinol-phosphate transaminase [Vicinamibacteria bacterium]|nr:histidinol-phosphate transaminase [Vicinamibacteria bacterium]
MHTRRHFMGALGGGVVAAAAPALPLPALAAAAPAPAEAVLLNSNENPYGPSPRAVKALREAWQAAARYPDAAEAELQDAVARHHGVSAEEVVLGCGSSEILQMADMAFLAEGKKAVCAEPTFEAVLAFARVTRAEPVKVPLTADFRHDLPAMAAAAGQAGGLIYVCNPNNPTATLVTRDELAAFLAAVPSTTVVLVDEAYHHFVEDARYASALTLRARHPNVVVARTFSKMYGLAGLRLGYAVASFERAQALREHASWSNANAAVLAAAQASLDDEAHVRAQRRRLNGTREWLCRELARDGRRFIPPHANFMMIHVGTDVRPVIEGFKARGLLVGRRFAAMPEWLRVTIGTDGEMRAFLKGLRALVPAVPATT